MSGRSIFSWDLLCDATAHRLEVPFFPYCFDFIEYPEPYTAADVAFSIQKLYTCLDRFKVKLSCVHTEDALTAEFHYDTCCFQEADIRRLAGHFHTLLEGITRNPDAAIGTVELLSEAERQHLLVELNQTAMSYPHDQCLHHLIEQQAMRTPDRPAVMCGERCLTYAALNARANQLAHHLRRVGVGPERLVGICVERSLEMVVGLLGIMKAGGGYVPLDPTYPAERLAFMVADAQVAVLLTQQRLSDKLPQDMAQVVALDTDWGGIAQESEADPVRAVQPDNLAYVIYTSGSTGKPKGAMIPHRGLVNYLNWCTKAYRVTEGRGVPVSTSIGFDLTVTSLFAPLVVGQCVVLLAEGEGIEALSLALRQVGDFSLVKLTPSHLEVLSHFLVEAEAAGQTRALIVGGEALWGKHLSFWRTHAPATRLINEYGPTETVVGCCVYEVPAGEAMAGPVPIGRPIGNTSLYVLDDALQPVLCMFRV